MSDQPICVLTLNLGGGGSLELGEDVIRISVVPEEQTPDEESELESVTASSLHLTT